MIHSMKLKEEPFKNMKKGLKTIELRLYDEKRQGIQAGDVIYFTCKKIGETLCVKVIGLHIFKSFKELYANLPLDKCGYEDVSEAKPEDMEDFYTKEEQEKYGVVGIEFTFCRDLLTSMQIKEVSYEDQDIGEASIIITDGIHEIACYAQPFSGISKKFLIRAFMDENVVRADRQIYSIEKRLDWYYGYNLCGKLLDKQNRLMCVGDIIIQLNYIPKDMMEGEFIEAAIVRLDFCEI